MEIPVFSNLCRDAMFQTRSRFIPAALLLLVALLIAPRQALTQTSLITSGYWDAPANWSNGVPTDAVDATIDNNLTASAPVGVSGTANHLYVGNTGTGSLNVDGGWVSQWRGYIGYGAGSNGTITVTSCGWGALSNEFGSEGSIYIGYSGTGTLNINGGCAGGFDAFIGCNAGANGTVNITSGTLSTVEILRVGSDFGTGTLNISGGYVKNDYGYISNGVANVTGGWWSSSYELHVGDGFGKPILKIGGGGVDTSVCYGQVTITGGTFACPEVISGALNLSGSGVVDVGMSFNGTLGSLSLRASDLSLGDGATAGTLIASSVVGGTGFPSVSFNHSGSYTFAPNLTGGLSVNKLGSGTTILTGTNNYVGTTRISSGKLAVALNGSLSGSTHVTISPGAVLDTAGLAPGLFLMLASQTFTFVLDPNGVGLAGLLFASGLDITTASVDFTTLGTLDDPCYVIANYTSLSGTAFASVNNLPSGYSIDYRYNNGTQIAVTTVPEPGAFALVGLGAAALALLPRKR